MAGGKLVKKNKQNQPCDRGVGGLLNRLIRCKRSLVDRIAKISFGNAFFDGWVECAKTSRMNDMVLIAHSRHHVIRHLTH